MTTTEAAAPFEVPVVDISPYVNGGSDEELARVAREIDQACRTVGFIQILGHGVPEPVIDGLKSALDDFFGQPLEVKKQYKAPSNRGYSPPKSERLSYSLGVESASRMNDFFEAFNIGNQVADFPDLDLQEAEYGTNVWPDVVGFQEHVSQYFDQSGRVARTLMTIFADALGVPREYFTPLTDHSIDVLRMNNYALPEGTVKLDGDLTGMGEHTDFGFVTVLWADAVRGLQVLDTAGVWHDVSPVEGGLLINLGDLTARLTNDAWVSTLHRVKPPIINGTIVRRRSVAFFHDGNVDAVIAPLPHLAGGEDSYEPITVRNHITAKLAGSRAGKSNTAATREASRVLAAKS